MIGREQRQTVRAVVVAWGHGLPCMPVTTSLQQCFDGWLSWLSLYAGGCGLPNAVGSPSAEESQSDIRKHWSFSRSYTANVNGAVKVCLDE